MTEPFDVFYKRNNPEGCQVCCGQGKLSATGRLTGQKLVVHCTYCDYTGKSDAPLFTDEDSLAFEAWQLNQT